MNVRFRTRAIADVHELIDYLAPRSPAAANRVPAAINKTVELVTAMPGIGERVYLRQLHDHEGLLKTPVLGFKRHMIYYLIRDGIEIVRVLHASRDRDSILEDEI